MQRYIYPSNQPNEISSVGQPALLYVRDHIGSQEGKQGDTEKNIDKLRP